MSFFFKKTNLCYRKKTSHWVHSFIKRNTEYKKIIHKNRNTSLIKIKDNQSIFTQVTKWLANMGFSLTFWWVIVDCCVILNLMPLLVTHPFLEFFNPTTLQHLSIFLIASKYFYLYKTLFWLYDEDYQRVAVLSTRLDKQAVLNEAPFLKRQKL